MLKVCREESLGLWPNTTLHTLGEDVIRGRTTIRSWEGSEMVISSSQPQWMEKEMATHSSVLAWRIPGTVEPGGLPSMGSHRVGHD